MSIATIRHVARAPVARARFDPSRQAAAQIYDRLRSGIISLKLEPGSIVDRGALQAAFGRSSTPIRDALLRLAEEGLVDIVPQSATRVSLIDIDRAREAQFLRRAMELEAVKTICEAPDKSVTGLLRQLIGEQRKAATVPDLEAFDDLDRAFHRRIYEAAGVPDLYALLRQRSGHIDRIRRLHLPVRGRMQEILRDHAQIVKAISTGAVAEAQARVREHLSHSLAYSPALREQHPAYFKPR